MQTILGSTGQIANALALELHRNYTQALRLVSRNPQKINSTDALFPANLLDAQQTLQAVQGSEVVYFTAGLPPNTALWEAQFLVMLKNSLDACRATGAKFVYFDNTYMYPQDGRLLTEDAPFEPVGRKGVVRAKMAECVLQEMARADIPVVIGRAPEFYGPNKTQSFTNALIIDRLKAGKTPRVAVRDDTLRTLIWTPDASQALAALGNANDAYGQTWHLPCCDERLTYQQFVTLACQAAGRAPKYQVLSHTMLKIAGLFSAEVREIQELLPRYQHDNLFDSSKFKRRFTNFQVTSYRAGLQSLF